MGIDVPGTAQKNPKTVKNSHMSGENGYLSVVSKRHGSKAPAHRANRWRLVRREAEMDHSQYIIDKLEEARDERGMPVAELARRSGIHRKRLWYILNGERKLRADEFIRLIIVMGTPVTTYVPADMLDALKWPRSNARR